MQADKHSIQHRLRKARRFEWFGFALLALMSLAVTAVAYAATGWMA